jgi:4-amino-4-deoxy-L-arabinose transferase-like glycosyltransferase
MPEPNTPNGQPQTSPPRAGSISRLAGEAGVVLLAGGIFAASVISFSRNASPTYDEVAFLPAGYAYLRWGDYRLNPEHPPLAKKLAALPLLWRTNWPANVDLQQGAVASGPRADGEAALRHAWATAFRDKDAYYFFGHAFLYGRQPGTWPQPDTNQPATTLPPGPQAFYNQADDLVFLGRMPILALGLGLALLVFVWAREWFGFAGGLLALTLFCFDPNFIAHSGLVTTDVAVSLFLFGAVYFMWRTCRQVAAANVILFLLFFGLAFATKFSAVLLIPIFGVTALGRILSPEPLPVGTAGRVALTSFAAKTGLFAGLFAAALLATWITIWASYSFRYSAAKDPETAAAIEAQIPKAGDPPAGPPVQAEDSRTQQRGPGNFPIETAVRHSAAIKKMLTASPPDATAKNDMGKIPDPAPLRWNGRLILFAQKHRLLPEAFLYGFVRCEMTSDLRSSFLLGRYSDTGFRSYFFYAFLLKTPLPVLLLIIAAVVLSLRKCGARRGPVIFLVAPAGLYFLAAIMSNLNIGQRHLLPMYPFLYVLAGGLALELPRLRQTARILALLGVAGMVAVSSRIVFFPAHGLKWQPVAPHYLAYFNELAGGPAHGFQQLVDSNLDWGQDLGNLKHWLAAHDIREPVCLCYFGMADPGFYQIAYYNLPGGYLFAPEQGFERLRPGGLLVISATSLQGVYFSPAYRQALQQVLQHCRLVEVIGYSIFIYQFEGFDAKTEHRT